MKKPVLIDTPLAMNPDQMHLARAETRINGLSVNAPGSAELARVQEARDEILSRMSAEDRAAYKKAADQKKTPEQRAEDAERQERADAS